MGTITPLFSTPLYNDTIHISEQCKNYIKSLEYKRTNSNDGFISIETNVLSNDSLIVLKQNIQNCISTYVHDMMGYTKSVEFYITNSWVTKHQKGDFAGPHDHNNSLISGTCYIDVTPDSGDFIIHSNRDSVFPSAVCIDSDNWTLFNSKTWSFQPKVGEVYLFPSTTVHSVNPSNSNSDRYCLAFNVYVKGFIGTQVSDNIGKLELK